LEDTLIIRQARWKIAIMCVGVAAFLAIFLYFVFDGHQGGYRAASRELGGWIFTPLLAALLIYCLTNLFAPPYLVLDRDGVRQRGLKLGPLIPWRDVRDFRLHRQSGMNLIVFDLQPHARAHIAPQREKDRITTERVAVVGGFLSGIRLSNQVKQSIVERPFDGNLMGFLSRPPDEVVTILEDWRRRHGAG
jgi:hypothetical protein